MAASRVARQPAAASMMARVDRLDLLLAYLEEMHRSGNGNGNGNASPNNSATTASSPSTPAAAAGHHRGLVSSDDDDDDSAVSASTSTPRGSKTWRRRPGPRPAKEVLEEAQAKGSLIDRIAFLEHRVLKMEEGMEITPSDHTDNNITMMSKEDPSSMTKTNKRRNKQGLKSLVKSCVRGNLKTKD